MPEFGFWNYVIFDLERGIPGYTQDYIKSNLTVEEVVQKWIMLKNKEHIEKQEKLAMLYHTSGYAEEEFKYTDVPFIDDKVLESRTKFDREKAWEEAPIYNLDYLSSQLSGIRNN